MKWYQRINPFFRAESSNMSNAGRWLADMLNSGFLSFTGKEVTVRSALSNTAVNAAVRVIAETIASVPLHVYTRVGEDGKKKARDHPLYDILHNQPNSQMTAFSFWEAALFWVLLGDGNFYAEIEKNNSDEIIGLWPLISNNMQIKKVDGKIWYVYTLPDGKQVPIPDDHIFHIHGLSSNGIKGFTPLQMAREAIALGLAVEEFGNRFFGNGGNVGGVLEHPDELGETGRQNLRESFEETFSGLSKSHRLLILEEGAKYVRTGTPPNEAQFLETRRFNVNDIARFFRVPPHMIGDLERSTNNNIEQQSLEFVKYTILPWVIRIEQTILWKLFTKKERATLFAEFMLDGLLRGDMKSRFEAFHIARIDGIITDDEWRAKENWNPLTDEQRKRTWRPVNMVPGDTPVDQVASSQAAAIQALIDLAMGGGEKKQ